MFRWFLGLRICHQTISLTMSDRFYSSSAWRRVRAAVLLRDLGLCKIRSSGCLVTASQVDHIVPRRLGGSDLDPRNLRAACLPCNLGRPDPRRLVGEVDVVEGPSREW